jgi:hypothetical protein
MKFLIQSDEIGRPLHDFSFTLLKVLDFYKWKGYDIDIKYWKALPLACMKHYNYELYVPIGDVDFVLHHLSLYHFIKPEPINVPNELYPFAGRVIENIYYDLFEKPVFVKSTKTFKSFSGIIHNPQDFIECIDEIHYQVSEVIDFESEWRAFVYKGELLDIRNYLGDFTVFPDIQRVRDMIDAWHNSPEAYTLDVGVLESGETVVIECHDFFSVGFYGFDNLHIPFMFQSFYRNITQL